MASPPCKKTIALKCPTSLSVYIGLSLATEMWEVNSSVLVSISPLLPENIVFELLQSKYLTRSQSSQPTANGCVNIGERIRQRQCDLKEHYQRNAWTCTCVCMCLMKREFTRFGLYDRPSVCWDTGEAETPTAAQSAKLDDLAVSVQHWSPWRVADVQSSLGGQRSGSLSAEVGTAPLNELSQEVVKVAADSTSSFHLLISGLPGRCATLLREDFPSPEWILSENAFTDTPRDMFPPWFQGSQADNQVFPVFVTCSHWESIYNQSISGLPWVRDGMGAVLFLGKEVSWFGKGKADPRRA